MYLERNMVVFCNAFSSNNCGRVVDTEGQAQTHIQGYSHFSSFCQLQCRIDLLDFNCINCCRFKVGSRTKGQRCGRDDECGNDYDRNSNSVKMICCGTENQKKTSFFGRCTVPIRD